ncbi:MAG: hypothetical protein U0263_00880 [Polyangiaceae bacterium]
MREGSERRERGEMKNDSDRKAVLARRRVLVASALAGLAVTQADCDNPARACLKVSVRTDAAAPLPCLSAPPVLPDASTSPTTADASVDGADAGTPKPCLGGMPPPRTP